MAMQDVMKVVRKSGIDYTIVINDLFHGWYVVAGAADCFRLH